MIVVDSSALVAMLLKEPQYEFLFERLVDADAAYMSAVNYVECSMVMSSLQQGKGQPLLDELIAYAKIELCDVTRRQAEFAKDAFFRFGKGRHKAKLNICDCFAYALAKEYRLPLLYKGNDFKHTDIKKAV